MLIASPTSTSVTSIFISTFPATIFPFSSVAVAKSSSEPLFITSTASLPATDVTVAPDTFTVAASVAPSLFTNTIATLFSDFITPPVIVVVPALYTALDCTLVTSPPDMSSFVPSYTTNIAPSESNAPFFISVFTLFCSGRLAPS